MIVNNEELSNIEYLYRYQPLNEDSIKIFTQGKLYFPPPETFNDPFDCKIDFNFNSCTPEDVKKFLEKGLEHLKKEHDIEELLKDTLNNENAWRRNLKEQALEILQPEINKIGILCLSKERSDILIWSHYTEGHKGFCLEFNKLKLENWKYCQPVDYNKEYLTFKEFNDAFPENIEKLIQLLLLRKIKCWKYENEWRVIVNPYLDNKGDRSYKFPEEILTGVVFGCEMTKDNKKHIQNWLNDRKTQIEFYESSKKEDEFGLEIRKIEKKHNS